MAKKKTQGWLDKYDVPQAQNGIEGTMGGLTDKGFNYNGSWGGQFQMGGSVYPVNYVPQAQKGEKVRFIEPRPIDYELQYSGDPSKKYPVSSHVMKQIVATSVGMGYDPKRALAVALQESGIGRTDPNYFHVLRGKTKSGKDRIPEEYQNLTMDELGIQLLKDKQKLANKLGYTTPEMELQTYNGLGKIFRDTEKDYHGFEMQKIYGVPIPEEGIDLRKNPLYGKRIMDLEKEVINKDPYVNQLVDYYNKFYSNPDSVYYTKASNLEPIEVVSPSRAKKQKTENSVAKEDVLKLVDDLKNGGSIPGSVGFTYARTQGAAPSEGPYAKKTMPSAQDGMTYYQHGLDWKPRNISRDGSEIPNAQTGDQTPINTLSLDEQMRAIPRNVASSTAIATNKPQFRTAREAEIARAEAMKAKQPVIRQGRKSTSLEEAERLRKNQLYVQSVPNAQIDAQGNISRVNPDRSVTGEAENFMSRREDKGREHMLGALEAAGYVEGLGALGSAAKKAIAQSMESGLLSEAYNLNPKRFKPEISSAYRMIGNEEGLASAVESGYFKPSVKGSDIGKVHTTTHYQIGAPSDGRKYFGRSWGRGYEGPYMVEVPGATNDVRFAVGPFDKKIGVDVWTYPESHIPISEANIYKKHWWQGYKPIEVSKPTSVSSSVDDVVDFSKYPSQLKAVQARAERLLSQKNKKGWNEQLTPDLEERLSTAVQRHDVAGDYPGTSLGANISGRTETLVSKDANIKGVPLTEAQKSMIAAHETGHYYSNSLKEGTDWQKYFDFSDLPYKTSKYLKGKSNYSNFSNEIRERAAQLKDYIAFKNKIPLNQDFKITRAQLDDALENYVKNTGLDNKMTPFIQALKKKGNISGFLKEMNKRPLSVAPFIGIGGAGALGAGALQQKKKGGVIKDNRGQWAHPGQITEIDSNQITMQGVPYPVLGIGRDGQQIMMQPGEEYTFNKGPVTEIPMAQDGEETPLDKKVADRKAADKETFKKGTDFLKDWYSRRAQLPQFKDLATRRLEDIDRFDLDYQPYEVMKEIGIGYYPFTGGDLVYFTDPADKSIPKDKLEESIPTPALAAHEVTHGLTRRNPQEMPEGYFKPVPFKDFDIYNPEKAIHSGDEFYYNWINSEGPIEYINKKGKQKTKLAPGVETEGTLAMLRSLENLDPTKTYTAEDVAPMIEKYSKMRKESEEEYRKTKNYPMENAPQMIEYMFRNFGNDPKRIAALLNDIVRTDSRTTPVAKNGGWLDKYN